MGGFSSIPGLPPVNYGRGNIVNYTYDFDEDGLRDPSYGHPTEFNLYGGVNWSLTYDLDDLIIGGPNIR